MKLTFDNQDSLPTVRQTLEDGTELSALPLHYCICMKWNEI